MADNNMFDEQGEGRRKRRRTDNGDAKTCPTNVVVPSIHSLPRELVVEILARIAAHSWEDLTNARLSCKRWNELGNDGFVYKHASPAKLPIVQWKPETAENKRKRCLFFQKCVDVRNFEALYRRGLVDYLESREEYDALGFLKKAASAGHLTSQYALCIISIFLGGEHKENGIHVLSEMISKESRKEMRTVREKLGNIINNIWMRNISFVKKSVCCTKHYDRVKNAWGPIDNDNKDLGMKCNFVNVTKKFLTFVKVG